MSVEPNAVPRCGDHVRYKGQTWVVAYADPDTGYMAWSGWPEGQIETAKVEIVYRCTDAEHAKHVAEWCDGSHGDDHRPRYVRRLYREEAGRPPETAEPVIDTSLGNECAAAVDQNGVLLPWTVRRSLGDVMVHLRQSTGQPWVMLYVRGFRIVPVRVVLR